MDENQIQKVMKKAQEVQEIGKYFNPTNTPVSRAQLTFSDFSETDPSKLYGNLNTIIYDALKSVSGNESTPLLGALESKPSVEVNSTVFNMHTRARDTAAASNYKLGETGLAYNPTCTYARKTNSMMTVGVTISRNMMARIVQAVPGIGNFDEDLIQRALMHLAEAKEEFLWNGSKVNENETDGVITILVREEALNNTATSVAYSGATGSNVLLKQDIENMLYSSIHNNGAMASNLYFWASHYALQTISEWYEDKKIYTTSNLFSFYGEMPQYQSNTGKKIPMLAFNQNITTNTSDKLILTDMSELGMVKLANFTTIKDMPITSTMDELNKAIVDSQGLNFLHTMTSGFISGIDRA